MIFFKHVDIDSFGINFIHNKLMIYNVLQQIMQVNSMKFYIFTFDK